MTENEYISLHKRLKKRYRERYPYNNRATIEDHYRQRQPAITTVPDPQPVYDYCCHHVDEHKHVEINLHLIDNAIRHCASHYADHQTAGRGLAHIEELAESDDIADLDTIHRIRQEAST